ncbi:hypothetical protein MTO96_010489 [Rhipicephalus appendiculatus]
MRFTPHIVQCLLDFIRPSARARAAAVETTATGSPTANRSEPVARLTVRGFLCPRPPRKQCTGEPSITVSGYSQHRAACSVHGHALQVAVGAVAAVACLA